MHRPLDRHDLFPHGPLDRLGGVVLIEAQTAGTNALLLERAAELADGAVAWTEFQTAGRGRQGRTWEAPRGSSILMSVLLIEARESIALRYATTVAALAVCDAVQQTTDCVPALRWPNDIFVASRKLGGVLAETRPLPEPGGAEGSDRCALVLGIGLNCLQQPAHFAGALAERATSLEIESIQPIDRATVAARILACLDGLLCDDSPAQERSAAWRRGWLARCDDAGTHVRLRENGRDYAGTALDVSEQGELIVQLDKGGRRSFAPQTTTRIW